MTRLSRASDLLQVFVLFPIAVSFAIAIVLAVGVEALAIYVGAILSAWLLFAYALPLLTGVMRPAEVHENIRARRRHGSQYEGEVLDAGSSLWRARTKELD